MTSELPIGVTDLRHRFAPPDGLPHDGAPRFREIEIDREDAFDRGIVAADQLAIEAHPFVLLGARLRDGFCGQGGRILLVTSTDPGNGKTFVSINLACAMAAIQPCVLVDLDLRRPSHAETLGVPCERGVDDYLTGEAAFEDVGMKAGGLNLTVFPARRARAQPTALLAEERMREFFDRLRALPGAPICIVDLPPTLLLEDVLLVVRAADGVLLVAEEGRTRNRDLKAAASLFGTTPLVGTVLNKTMASSRNDKLSKYYRSSKSAERRSSW